MSGDVPDERDLTHEPRQTLEQRMHLRRILRVFAVVVVLLPLAGLGDGWSWLLLPVLAAAAYGLREAIRLRRTITRPDNTR